MTPYHDIQSRRRERRSDILGGVCYALLGAAALAFFQWIGI